jgi:hypothetical protein
MPNQFDKQAFLNRIKDLDWHQMIDITSKEVGHVESISYNIKGAVKNREQGSVGYIDFLKGFLFWLSNGIKPAGLSNDEFRTFRPICEKLIEKKQLKPEALSVFKK